MNNGVTGYTDGLSQAAQTVAESMGSRIKWPGLESSAVNS